MSWCSHCSDHHPTSQSPNGFSSCSSCGRILSHHHHHHQQQTLLPTAIDTIAAALNLTLSPPITSFAHNLFTLSQSNPLLNLHRRRRRRIQIQLAAVCLYIALRRHRHRHKPLMLIQLSCHLSTSLYSLAAIFALLCKIFKIKRLGSSDPCLFMHRFSSRMLGREDSDVAITALRVIAEARRTKKNEENPIGFCNAALYLAASIHGHVFSMLEVVGAVSAGFESMSSSGLSVEEFVSRADDSLCKRESESVCGHEGRGLCKQCYDVFVEMSAVGSSKKRRRSEEDVGDDVDVYINSEKERQYRSLIWEEMNREYLEEQLAKKVADLSAVRPRKERKQRGDKELKSAKKKVEEKRLSSKVNYDVLSQLFEDGEGKRTEMNMSVSDEEPKNGVEEEGEEFDEETGGNCNEEEVYQGYGDGEEGYGEGEYIEYLGDGNEEYGDDDFEF